MGLLSTALSSGLKYASDKYSADKHLEAVKSQNATALDKVASEHNNALARMDKEHKNTLERMDIQHQYDIDRENTRGKFGIFNSVIDGVSGGIGSYIKGKTQSNHGGDRNNKGGGLGTAPNTSTLESKWDDLMRKINDTSPSGSTRFSSNFQGIPLSQLLSTGAAIHTGVAGITPLLAF